MRSVSETVFSNRPIVIWTLTPCHGRADLVTKLLTSLVAAQDTVALDAVVKICLIDSTPEDSTSARQIQADCASCGAVYLRGPESVRAKRNAAARYAINQGADILFFTDSDCEVTRDIFTEHLSCFLQTEAPFTHRPIGAVTGVTRFVGTESGAYRAAARTPFLDSFSFAERMPEAPFAPCTNLSVRAIVFEQVGGFPEGWQYRLGGDDTELGRRINNAGHAIASAPRGVVYHSTSTWSSWTAVMERAWRWGRMDIPVRQAEPRQNIQWIGPMPLQVALLALPLSLLAGWPSGVILLLIALLVSPALSATLRASTWREWPALFGAEQLLAMFQLGSILESFRRLQPWWSYREIVTHPMQIGTSWEHRRRSAWVTIWMVLLWATTTCGWLKLLEDQL